MSLNSMCLVASLAIPILVDPLVNRQPRIRLRAQCLDRPLLTLHFSELTSHKTASPMEIPLSRSSIQSGTCMCRYHETPASNETMCRVTCSWMPGSVGGGSQHIGIFTSRTPVAPSLFTSHYDTNTDDCATHSQTCTIYAHIKRP